MTIQPSGCVEGGRRHSPARFLCSEVDIMLKEAKLAMAITTNAYDGELAGLLDAAAKDLTLAGVTLPGTVAFEVTTSGIQDTSTLTDSLCQRAMITYARMYFRSPDDYERLREAYDAQKVILMHATGYTDYGEPAEDGGEDDGQS